MRFLLAHSSTLVFIFLPQLSMRIWPPIHPGKANPPSSLRLNKRREVAFGPRHFISLPRTSAPYVLFMSCFIQPCAHVSRLCATATRKLVAARQKCRRWERNRGKRSYNLGAGSKLGALADVRGRRSTTQSPHPRTGAGRQGAPERASPLNAPSTISFKKRIWCWISFQLQIIGGNTP